MCDCKDRLILRFGKSEYEFTTTDGAEWTPERINKVLGVLKKIFNDGGYNIALEGDVPYGVKFPED